ncbi:MAG: hypothetical protein CL608_28795 [Anaerolineaceae bacterium]|nr:hypothetical protein [Anaerolineaceae bacterium]
MPLASKYRDVRVAATMKASRSIFLTVAVAILVCLWSLVAVATPGDPAPYFTDNLTATSASTTVTNMEQALLDRLSAATTSIDAALYELDRVSIRDALIAAHNRGVLVRVVTDDDDGYVDNAVHFQALESAGITVVHDNRSSLMHNKFIVIDGQYVWTGSTNLTDNGLTLNHNNSLLFDASNVATIFTIEFEEMFESGLFGTAKTDNTVHTLTYDGSDLEIYFSPSDGALTELIAEVNNAQYTIAFSIFSFTDDALRDALIAARNRGVVVRGLWDTLGAGNQYSEDETLCSAGVALKRDTFSGILHNKYMIIDAGSTSPVLVTGSMNWSNSGENSNDENTLIFHDADAVAAYAGAWETLWDAIPSSAGCNLGGTIYLPIVLLSDPSSTPTPTPTAPANVQITIIVYDPSGDDVAGEYVTITNQGATAENMTGWVLSDVASTAYVFPSFSLAPSASVRVWTKSGTDSVTDLYWGRGSAIWNNTGDTATLRNSSSQVIDTCTYSGGGVSANCP